MPDVRKHLYNQRLTGTGYEQRAAWITRSKDQSNARYPLDPYSTRVEGVLSAL